MPLNLADSDPMPFGKYKGQKMEDVPAQYLLWLYDENIQHAGVKDYIERSYSALLTECKDYIPKRKPTTK